MATLQVNVTAELSGLSSTAQAELTRCVGSIADELVQQAAREELAQRASGVTIAEINATHVLAAEKIVRGVNRITKRPSVAEAITIVGIAVFSGGAGILGGALHSLWQSALFGASAMAGIALTWKVARRAS